MLEEYAKKQLENWILKGGELVSDEVFLHRMQTCKTLENGKPCRYFGEVKVAGFSFSEGCQACGCPAATKFRMKSLNPVVAQMLQGGVTEIICKHPEGNKWEQ